MYCRYLYFFTFLIFHCFVASAQQCSPTFHEVLVVDGECAANAVIYTPNDQVIVAGKLAHDAFILKTAPNGQVIWGHSFHNTDTSIINSIKLTSDGNYIVLGTIARQLWIAKIDTAGTPIWNKRLPMGPAPLNAKEIIELSTGGFAIISNSNDSTSASDGIVARLDATGDPLWIKQFDGNGADGFNYIHEVNGQLLISGYITGDLKDAFLMKLDPADGSPIKTTSYSRTPGWDEEGINISTIPNGYSWGIKMTLTPTGGGYSSDALEIIKSDLNDNNFLVQQVPVGFGAILPMKNLQVKPTALNDGFIFINNYPDNFEFPTIGKVESAGHKEWSRNYSPNYAYSGRDFNSIDLTSNHGYVVAGRARFLGDNILLMKTDLAGIAGSCANGADGGDGGGNDNINGVPFSWASINDQTSIITTPVLAVDQMDIFVFTNCTGQSCPTPPPVDNGDDCTTSVLTSIKDPYSVSMSDAVRASDGDIITIGSRSYYWTYRSQILKLKPGGNIRWAKQFDSKSTEDGYDVLTKIIKTTDDNYILSGYSQVTIDHSVYDSVFLMKINNAGDLLWSKRMAETPYSVGNSFTAATPDTGFIMASNSGYSNDIDKVMKFNAAGDIVWQRQILNERWNKTIQAMQYDNGSIYLCLDMSDYTQTRLEVVKLNATDGSYIWSKEYYVPATALGVLGIESIQDSLYVGLAFYKTQTNAGVLKLDTKTGKQLGGYYLSVPLLSSGAVANTFTKTIDNNLILAHDATVNGTAGIFVSKFKPDGSNIWQRNFTQLNKHTVSSLRQDGTGCIITGTQAKKNALNEAANEGFVMRLTSDGEIENASGDCVSQPITVSSGGSTTTPLTMTEEVTTVTGVTTAGMNLTRKSITLYESPTLGYPSCASFNVCLNVTADGPEKICDLQQTYIYHATRSSSCTTPLIWKVDPEYASIISQTGNDATVKFLKRGNTVVTALLDAGCQMIPANKTVEIAKPASDLDLGDDFELCQGRSITLDAGKGFVDYEWNDGSTNQQLTITSPGTYTVKVTDACNNANTSDVIVSDGGNHPFSLGPDILKCAETSVTINLPANFQNLNWNTSYNKTDLAAQAILFPALDTTYILSGTRGVGCTFADTLKVKIIPPVRMGFPEATSICPGQSIQLSVTSDFTNLIWTGGLSGYGVSVSSPGTYIASAIDINGCVSKDTFELRSILSAPTVSLSKETFICEGTEKILDAGDEGISYLWSTGETKSHITVNTPGQWWVLVTGSNNCTATDTSRITSIKTLPHDFLVSDTLMCLRGEIDINAPAYFRSYRWSNGSASSVLHTEKAGVYYLNVTDQYGCNGSDSVYIGTKDCGWGVYVPSAFSPNNDGKNDMLRPVVLGRVNKFLFMVFDRWGNLVYQTNQTDQGWDGFYKNQPANIGAYVWMCEYELNGDEPKIIKGAATLIR